VSTGVSIGVGDSAKVEWWPDDWAKYPEYVERLKQNSDDNLAYCQAIYALTESGEADGRVKQGGKELSLRWVLVIIATCMILAILAAELGKAAGPPW